MRSRPTIPATPLLLALLAACAARPLDPARLRWVPQQSGTTASLRGVCAVSPRVAWASGSGGTFRRTVDGGRSWEGGTVTGAEELDLRDVHAVSAQQAWLFSAGSPAHFYRTLDGGLTWTLEYADDRADVFFDGAAFWNEHTGIAFGDPIDGVFLVVTTQDGGDSWTPVPAHLLPPPLPGEAAFAASGTCVAVHGEGMAWAGTGGGAIARVLRTADRGRTWAVAPTPLRAGAASAGIFSLAFRDAWHGIAVGGDYRDAEGTEANAARTDDGGATWQLTASPRGYRSAVAWVPGSAPPACIAAGPTGTDISLDGGRSWRALGDEGYHALSFTPDGDAAWAVGADGRIARLAGLGEDFAHGSAALGEASTSSRVR